MRHQLLWLLLTPHLVRSTADKAQQPSIAPAEVPITPDRTAHAIAAYNEAVECLASIASVQPPKQRTSKKDATTVLSGYDGPIANALRITLQVVYQPWIPWAISLLTERTASRRYTDAKAKASIALELLEFSAKHGHTDALYKLAQINLFPPPILARNPARAFEFYAQHADLTGNATSQSLTGFFYATGYGGSTEQHQAKALLYYTFAAHGGDTGAQMALAYRHWSGIGVKEDCMTALEWYEAVAEKAIQTFQAGPPGGRTLPLTATRLSDFDGGVFGAGASVSSTGFNINRNVNRAHRARAAGEKWSDVVAYYTFNADRGDLEFALRLGRIFYQGSLYTVGGGISGGAEAVGAVPRDFHKARTYFTKIARLVYPRDNAAAPLTGKKDGHTDTQKLAASIASAYLGRMYLRGEGVRQDARAARMWFERGADAGNAECANGLGIIWRDGLVDGEHAEAQTNLGKYFLARGELVYALGYFEAALKNGSPFEAYYYIARMNAANAYAAEQQQPGRGGTVGGACSIAVSFYKHAAERGTWRGDNLQGEAEQLWFREAAAPPDRDGALLRWWLAAERGFESAQNNLAYVLDQDRDSLRATPFSTPVANASARTALAYWIRSSAQRNIDALVKVGDYYYHGLGVSGDEPEHLRWEKAAGYYLTAVETHVSALAMWNLGWMYENGRGVTQDYHLAKRYYDMALETNSEAAFPVWLSLVKLQARSLWYQLTGGSEKALTLSLWDDEDADGWQFSKAKDELVRRLRGERVAAQAANANAEADPAVGEAGQPEDGDLEQPRAQPDEDPIQWARDRRNRDAEAAGDEYGGDDYWDGSPARQRRRAEAEEDEDDIQETVILLVLCAVVTGLIWMRGRWAERRRQEEQQDPNAPPPFQAQAVLL
ncbi:hypothetical protein BKA62DRAFT_763445 [Auriculariales sp. MPI-PUGE-AT-0066]|nr:hypothetical protein BKA62DRAFT_763445 [Auriculariales sp. MPI-PUGE-AT-0066]